MKNLAVGNIFRNSAQHSNVVSYAKNPFSREKVGEENTLAEKFQCESRHEMAG
ncbi:MAG: hypothetical protein KDH98_07110 [Calditrichaeota bacterium]|nr:hypothetical protein [Calditrichota bacterium]